MPQAGCPGHLGKHLGPAGPGWLPTPEAGGTLQSGQCVPCRSLEPRPVYFLREAVNGTEAISEPPGRLSFQHQEASRKPKYIFQNGSLATVLEAVPGRRVELTAHQGPS
jgi:hypothetical protein